MSNSTCSSACSSPQPVAISDYSCEQDDVTEVCFIRLGLETGPRCSTPCERFADWHQEPDQLHDPVLSSTGFVMCSSGVPEQAVEVGLGGINGGLWALAADLQPQLVLCSPTSACIQSAVVAFGGSEAPIVVHPALKTFKKRPLTANGQYPDGAPKYKVCASTTNHPVTHTARRAARSTNCKQQPSGVVSRCVCVCSSRQPI
jgi:hypothetical protein